VQGRREREIEEEDSIEASKPNLLDALISFTAFVPQWLASYFSCVKKQMHMLVPGINFGVYTDAYADADADTDTDSHREHTSYT
jgi:hypothetical protein